MKKYLFTILLLLGSGLYVFAQNSIKGVVLDTANTPLPSATVMLLNAADSSLASFSLTDGQGAFDIKKVAKGDYLFRVTYIGYSNYDKPMQFDGNTGEVDMGSINLESVSTLIDEVVVMGERNPIEIKKDTIEFNAASFKTQPNAVVEDLLKQLPGVEVERDGAVTAQGETVERVLVDGKEFFGRDPKIATKNLPADAVDKVQVFDRKSDQSQFTGIDDGEREKTINLTLKEDRKKGAFGTVSAGYGDAGRFAGKASINSFNKASQLSFIGTANNTNEQGFSMSDYSNFMGSSGGFGGRGGRGGGFGGGGAGSNLINQGRNSGIATTYAGGLNYNKEFSKKTKLNASYFFSRFDKLTETDTWQETFLNENAFISEEFNSQDDLNMAHALNMTLESDLDSLSSFILRSSGNYNTTNALGILESQSFLSTLEPRNGIDQNSSNEGDILRANVNLLYRKKFRRAGRNFSANLTYGMNNTDLFGDQESLNTFYVDNGNVFTDNLLQDYSQDNTVDNYGAKLSFTEPLGKRRYLEFNYQYSKNKTDVQREVYDLDTGLPIFNTQLSNIYRSGYTYNNGGVNFLLNRTNFNLTMGATLQNSHLDGDLILTETEIIQDFTNILPRLDMRYNFTSTKNLSMEYETNVIEPTIQQLQPIVDNSNPLNTYEGNPNLRPEYRHNLRMRFFSFSPSTFTNFFSTLTLTYTNNKIKNEQVIDERLVTKSRPINVNDDYRANLFLNYGSRINALSLRYNIGPSVVYSRGITFINTERNFTDQVTTSVRVRFNNLNQEKVDIALGGRVGYTTTQYSIADNQNRDFINHNYYAELNFVLPKDWRIGSDLDYDIYTGLSDDFNQGVPIWGAYISKIFLKGQKGELKFGAFDILDRNRGISRVNDLNYTLDQQVNSLGRYFLLSFTYNIRGFGDKSNTPNFRRYR